MNGDSPFRRLRSLANVNQTRMAELALLSRQTIATIELGMYDTVPTKANHALADACRSAGVSAWSVLEREYGVPTLDGAMDAWKAQKRAQTDLHDWPALSLAQIVNRFDTPRQFCDKLCIPTYALHNALYRDEVAPQVIRTALRQAGYLHASEAA